MAHCDGYQTVAYIRLHACFRLLLLLLLQKSALQVNITLLFMCNLLRPWAENRYRTECTSGPAVTGVGRP